MKAEAKAIELHDKYYQIFEPLGLDSIPNDHAKQCALICVDEITSVIGEIHLKHFNDAPTLYWDKNSKDQYHYWKKVREHIRQM